jgi:hypothetical protein
LRARRFLFQACPQPCAGEPLEVDVSRQQIGVAVVIDALEVERCPPGYPSGAQHALVADVEQVDVLASAASCASLKTKPISPHTLRHTAAMRLLHAGVDITVIALWLGHDGTQTTHVYLHADLALKERALARTAPPNTTPGRYRPPDQLLAFLESL